MGSRKFVIGRQVNQHAAFALGRARKMISAPSSRVTRSCSALETAVVTALTLRDLLADQCPHPELLVELLDQENQYLLAKGNEDAHVSPMVVRYLVSQVALRRELAWVFWELTRPWGAQFVLRHAAPYLAATEPVRFDRIQQIAAAHGEIAIGIRQSAGDGTGLVLNPDRGARWTFEANDQLLVLTTIKEPEVDATT